MIKKTITKFYYTVLYIMLQWGDGYLFVLTFDFKRTPCKVKICFINRLSYGIFLEDIIYVGFLSPGPDIGPVL